jgi:hypothetical protein
VEPGDHVVTVVAKRQRYEKNLPTGGSIMRRSPVRPDRTFWRQLLYPAEPALPAGSPLSEIRVELPEAQVDLLGWTVGPVAGIPAWMLVYFLVTAVLAFTLRRPMGVQI